MPPDAITDLVTHDGRQQEEFSEGIYVRFTNTTRHTETLNKRVQATKNEYSKSGMVREDIPGADQSRFTLNPLIDACFVRMSNALTQIEHVQDTRDVVAAAGEMDEYHFYLRSLHNNATRYAGYETQAGFYPEPEDSLVGVRDAVQDSLRLLELEVTQKCLEYWGSQQDPPRILDPDKFQAKVEGWEFIEGFRDALGTVEHRNRTGTDCFGSNQSPEEERMTLDQEVEKLFMDTGDGRMTEGQTAPQITWQSSREKDESHNSSQ